jgi:hypothetical protein
MWRATRKLHDGTTLSTHKANLVVRRVGSLILLRQNAETATDDEWANLLRFIVSLRNELNKVKFVVRTDGGGPSPSQRKSLEQALGGAPARVAVVSDHLKVRFVTSTIALFQKELRSFLVKEIAQAYDHLGMMESERRQADMTLREMETELAK